MNNLNYIAIVDWFWWILYSKGFSEIWMAKSSAQKEEYTFGKSTKIIVYWQQNCQTMGSHKNIKSDIKLYLYYTIFLNHKSINTKNILVYGEILRKSSSWGPIHKLNLPRGKRTEKTTKLTTLIVLFKRKRPIIEPYVLGSLIIHQLLTSLKP